MNQSVKENKTHNYKVENNAFIKSEIIDNVNFGKNQDCKSYKIEGKENMNNQNNTSKIRVSNNTGVKNNVNLMNVQITQNANTSRSNLNMTNNSMISGISTISETVYNKNVVVKWPLIFHCIIKGTVKDTKKAIKRGENVNCQLKFGESPLSQAVELDKEDQVTTLLKYNADPNLSNKDGITALHIAVMRRHSTIVKLLLVHNANPNCVNRVFKQTPLHMCILTNSTPEILYLLIHFGANLMLKDYYDKTPFDYIKPNQIELKKAIEKLKLNLNTDIMKLNDLNIFSNFVKTQDKNDRKNSENISINNIQKQEENSIIKENLNEMNDSIMQFNTLNTIQSIVKEDGHCLNSKTNVFKSFTSYNSNITNIVTNNDLSDVNYLNEINNDLSMRYVPSENCKKSSNNNLSSNNQHNSSIAADDKSSYLKIHNNHNNHMNSILYNFSKIEDGKGYFSDDNVINENTPNGSEVQNIDETRIIKKDLEDYSSSGKIIKFSSRSNISNSNSKFHNDVKAINSKFNLNINDEAISTKSNKVLNNVNNTLSTKNYELSKNSLNYSESGFPNLIATNDDITVDNNSLILSCVEVKNSARSRKNEKDLVVKKLNLDKICIDTSLLSKKDKKHEENDYNLKNNIKRDMKFVNILDSNNQDAYYCCNSNNSIKVKKEQRENETEPDINNLKNNKSKSKDPESSDFKIDKKRSKSDLPINFDYNYICGHKYTDSTSSGQNNGEASVTKKKLKYHKEKKSANSISEISEVVKILHSKNAFSMENDPNLLNTVLFINNKVNVNPNKLNKKINKQSSSVNNCKDLVTVDVSISDYKNYKKKLLKTSIENIKDLKHENYRASRNSRCSNKSSSFSVMNTTSYFPHQKASHYSANFNVEIDISNDKHNLSSSKTESLLNISNPVFCSFGKPFIGTSIDTIKNNSKNFNGKNVDLHNLIGKRKKPNSQIKDSIINDQSYKKIPIDALKLKKNKDIDEEASEMSMKNSEDNKRKNTKNDFNKNMINSLYNKEKSSTKYSNSNIYRYQDNNDDISDNEDNKSQFKNYKDNKAILNSNLNQAVDKNLIDEDKTNTINKNNINQNINFSRQNDTLNNNMKIEINEEKKLIRVSSKSKISVQRHVSEIDNIPIINESNYATTIKKPEYLAESIKFSGSKQKNNRLSSNLKINLEGINSKVNDLDSKMFTLDDNTNIFNLTEEKSNDASPQPDRFFDIQPKKSTTNSKTRQTIKYNNGITKEKTISSESYQISSRIFDTVGDLVGPDTNRTHKSKNLKSTKNRKDTSNNNFHDGKSVSSISKYNNNNYNYNKYQMYYQNSSILGNSINISEIPKKELENMLQPDRSIDFIQEIHEIDPLKMNDNTQDIPYEMFMETLTPNEDICSVEERDMNSEIDFQRYTNSKIYSTREINKNNRIVILERNDKIEYKPTIKSNTNSSGFLNINKSKKKVNNTKSIELANWLTELNLQQYYSLLMSKNICDLDSLYHIIFVKYIQNFSQVKEYLKIESDGHLYRIIIRLKLDYNEMNDSKNVIDYILSLNSNFNINSNVSNLKNSMYMSKYYGNQITCCGLINFIDFDYNTKHGRTQSNLNREKAKNYQSFESWLKKYDIDKNIEANFTENGFDYLEYFLIMLFSNITIDKNFVKKHLHVYSKESIEKLLLLFENEKIYLLKECSKEEKLDMNNSTISNVKERRNANNKKLIVIEENDITNEGCNACTIF